MGAITDDLKRQIKELTVVLNETTDPSDKADIQEGIDELEKELADLEKAKVKPTKKSAPSNEIKDAEFDKFCDNLSSRDVADTFLANKFYNSLSKAKKDTLIARYMEKLNNFDVEGEKEFDLSETKKYIEERLVTKEETKKDSKSKKKFSDLEVGSEIIDEDGNKIKHTKEDTYIIHYHQGKNTIVAIEKKGGKWIYDCCEKKGIEFSATDVDNGIEKIIEGLDCHYELEKRKEAAKKRKIAREKYEKLSDSEKVEKSIEKTVDSVENKVDDIKKEGKGIAPSKAKSFGVDIAKLVKVIDRGIKEEAERKKFVENLIKELQKLI